MNEEKSITISLKDGTLFVFKGEKVTYDDPNSDSPFFRMFSGKRTVFIDKANIGQIDLNL